MWQICVCLDTGNQRPSGEALEANGYNWSLMLTPVTRVDVFVSYQVSMHARIPPCPCIDISRLLKPESPECSCIRSQKSQLFRP